METWTTTPGKLAIVFIGLPRSEGQELLKQKELSADPKEAFDQIWKKLSHTQNGWYLCRYDQDSRLWYIMHESKTLELKNFFP